MNEYRWGDLQLGMKAAFEASFTPEMMRQYAEISGDYNPLHVDGEYAQAQGFPAPVVFGLMTSSLYSRLAGMYLPGKYALLQGLDVEFSKPVFAGQRLQVEGEVIFLSDAVRRMEVKARIRNEEGKLVSKALIRVGVHGEGVHG